jgi:hypothetical protein
MSDDEPLEAKSYANPSPSRQRVRNQRQVDIKCSHCLQVVQFETFKLHVDLYWDHHHNTWHTINPHCASGCAHNHEPSRSELVQINKVGRNRPAKRRRVPNPAGAPAGGSDPVNPYELGEDPVVESDDDNLHLMDDPVDVNNNGDVPHINLDWMVEGDPELDLGPEQVLEPEWMSYHPGAHTPPVSTTRIRAIVNNYDLSRAAPDRVRERVDMLTLYIWYLQGETSESAMGRLLINRSFSNPIPFLTLSVEGLRTYLGFKQRDQEQGWNDAHDHHWEFQQIVTCSKPGCNRCSLYSTLPQVDGQAPTCTAVEYPLHPHNARRSPCGNPLTSPPVRIRQHLVWKPNWLLMYKSPIEYLNEFMLRPGYASLNEHWRDRVQQFDPFTGEAIGCDFYDFSIWKSFHAPGGHMNWARHGNQLIMLNADWYQPYEHTTASLGLVWAVNLCTPREHRYKKSNVMLIAVFPGTSEKSLRVDRLLEPLVRDLLASWHSNPALTDPVQRVAVAYVAADSPAVRKVGGFGTISGTAGCLVCHKKYARYVNHNGNEQQAYHHIDACRQYQSIPDEDDGLCEHCPATKPHHDVSRPDRLRTHDEVVAAALAWRDAPTPAAQNRLVHEEGITWSSLHVLPYFNFVTMLGIDALHHLWHGIIQTLIAYWIEVDILSEADMEKLQAIIQAARTPYDIGAMNTKMLDKFARMTAADQMQFVLVYSDTLFRHFLNGAHLKVWTALSRAASLLSQTSFTPSELDEAERAAYEFNRILSATYHGRAFIPKCHELTHSALKIRQGGPHHGTHTFMFEGMNGQAQKINHNVHQIQLSIMRRWSRRNSVVAVAHVCLAELTQLLSNCPGPERLIIQRAADQLTGTLNDIDPVMMLDHPPSWFTDMDVDMCIRMSQVGQHRDGSEFLPGGIVGGDTQQALGEDERGLLRGHWEALEMVPPPGCPLRIPIVCTVRGPALSIAGEVFTSTGSRSQRSSFILACYQDDDDQFRDFPAQVTSYITVQTDVVPMDIAEMMHPSEAEVQMMADGDFVGAMRTGFRRHGAMQARVDFDRYVELDDGQYIYKAKRRSHCYAFLQWFKAKPGSVTEWLFEIEGMGIMPVHRIKSRFTQVSIRDHEVFELLPIPRRIHLAASCADR